MKKIFILMLGLMMAGSLTGCGNQSWGPGNYNFTHVHFSDNLEGYCATVEKWHESNLGIEVETIEYDNMFLSEGTYIILKDGNACPFCK